MVLTKEYRICLPMTVQEYRIAQLYMIQKKSREESSSAGSGVEILINEPYTDGPGGNGQYTHKIYHIGSHMPGWFRAVLPKSALQVEEQAWNAYPYTKTIYKCPFIEKFSLEIETCYLDDGGEEENVFNLPKSELRGRSIDYLDIVKDPISSGDYKKEEDPKLFVSEKTGRGPLTETWREDYTKAMKLDSGNTGGKRIMCAYKLCKVEFKYWGMQSKIERFIHDIGLRKTMLRAHRQAWAWQDEYYGLTIDDIRALERETQLALKAKMTALLQNADGNAGKDQNPSPKKEITEMPCPPLEDKDTVIQNGTAEPSGLNKIPSRISIASQDGGRRQSWASARSRISGASNRNLSEWNVESLEQLRTSSSDEEEFYDAPEDLDAYAKSHPGLFKSSSMELLNDEMDGVNSPPLSRQSTADETLLTPLDRRMEQYRHYQAAGSSHSQSLDGTSGLPYSPAATAATSGTSCRTTILFMVLHGGSIMDTGQEHRLPKRSDLITLRSTFESVVKAHYPAIQGHLSFRLIPCPSICSDTINLLASLNPFSFDSQSPGTDSTVVTNENFPLGAISLFATSSPEYCDAVAQLIARANSVYNEFLRSEEGLGFNGQVCLIGDSLGSIMGYDCLCKNNPYLASLANSRYGSHGSLHENGGHSESEGTDTDHHVSRRTNLETIKQQSISNPDLTLSDSADVAASASPSVAPPCESFEPTPQRRVGSGYTRHASCPNSRRTSTGSQSDLGKFEFEVTDFFMFGSPLALVLAYRRFSKGTEKILPQTSQFLDPLAAAIGHQLHSCARDLNEAIPRPSCHQLYNMFYPSDLSAIRVEPLIYERFKHLVPMKVPRYQKFPLGDGQSVHVVETVQSNCAMLLIDSGSCPSSAHCLDQPPNLERRHSNMSIGSQTSGYGELSTASITSVTSRWWGNKRLDYALYCPDTLQSFPTTALPYLLHASFWESTDAVAFILRQVVRQDYVTMQSVDSMMKEVATFKPVQPREKWLKRRTTIKLRNVAPNHRANDVIVLEDRPQILTARFMYGPLDMVSLSGEKVDVHIMTQPSSGEWQYFGTEVTDSTGRAIYRMADDQRLSMGIYPVKMVVRGDHTAVDFHLTVLPPKTETVVFSIDGSFTASMSIMGKDPKVRPGAVDVVRHWQELGYLIVYITARPDMQQKKVVAWLAQHNFPHGMVAFMDGLSAEPLKQKANFLKNLVQEAQIHIHAAYGSAKDLTVYQAVGLQSNQIYIVGKVSKKHHKDANVISDGYASHLSGMAAHEGSRPAVGNARMFIRKGCFSLPGQRRTTSKKSLQKTASLPYKVPTREASLRQDTPSSSIGVSGAGNTVVEAGAGTAAPSRARGVSPRLKLIKAKYDSSNV